VPGGSGGGIPGSGGCDGLVFFSRFFSGRNLATSALLHRHALVALPLVRSHGCQKRASVTFTASTVMWCPLVREWLRHGVWYRSIGRAAAGSPSHYSQARPARIRARRSARYSIALT